jgi:hypothetical protein
MNKRQIDIMVAQATNKSMPPKYGPNWDGDTQWTDNGDGTWTGESWPSKPEFSESCYWPPHYSTDIAAIREVEDWIEKQGQTLQYDYGMALQSVLLESGSTIDATGWCTFHMAHATPLQRCLAFLKARGVEVEE